MATIELTYRVYGMTNMFLSVSEVGVRSVLYSFIYTFVNCTSYTADLPFAHRHLFLLPIIYIIVIFLIPFFSNHFAGSPIFRGRIENKQRPKKIITPQILKNPMVISVGKSNSSGITSRRSSSSSSSSSGIRLHKNSMQAQHVYTYRKRRPMFTDLHAPFIHDSATLVKQAKKCYIPIRCNNSNDNSNNHKSSLYHQKYAQATMVTLSPISGYTHQLRLVLQARGLPIGE